jgi:protein arginine kinase activator
MLCSQCHERTAVVNLHQIADGEVVLLHLCERCAAEKGVDSSSTLTKTPVGTFLASMGKGLDLPNGDAIAEGAAASCPACGATLDDFRETGRVGCAQCYKTFEVALRELLRRLHGSSRHFGERYRPAESETGVPTARELREQLRVAVEAEDFELAAELRDRLRVVETPSD